MEEKLDFRLSDFFYLVSSLGLLYNAERRKKAELDADGRRTIIVFAEQSN